MTSGSFSRDGKLVLTTSRDGTARLWRARTGAPVLVVEHGRPVLSGSLSDDGRLLITISSDREGQSLRTHLFALPSGRLVRQLPAKGVTTASFNPAGTLLVTGAEDHTAAVWRIADGRRLHVFADHQGGVTDAVFSPDGKLIVTTSSDGATRVWDTKTGERVALMLGHANAVNSSSFSKDGKFIVTASADGTARVWEAATGRFVAVLRGHTDSVTKGAFSAGRQGGRHRQRRRHRPGLGSGDRTGAPRARSRLPRRSSPLLQPRRPARARGRRRRPARILTAGGRVLRPCGTRRRSRARPSARTASSCSRRTAGGRCAPGERQRHPRPSGRNLRPGRSRSVRTAACWPAPSRAAARGS